MPVVAGFSKVLVANRGEIAIRIFRTLRELGIAPVAVYSEADRRSLHVRAADEAYLLGPGPPAESYLVQERVIDAAKRSGAEAIHPGYGFLAENAAFARAVENAGLTWIGPPPDAIDVMGSKVAARERMQATGVPIIPGTTEPVSTAEDVRELGDELGWPVAIKASAGGGGKGLKVVRSADEVERAFESARREGEAYFSDPAVYVERYLEDPRHVEVQVLADAHGAVIHLGQIAVDAARAVGYRSAGTIEGLLSQEGEYFFLEMNTRIQVEHTVTELVTGLDLIREQVLIAAGEPLSLRQEDLRLTGHAIECRINAEDPSNGFLPSPGRITGYAEPGGPGVRVDSSVEAGSDVVGLYDPLVAKLCAHGVDREHARRRMLRALGEYRIEGVTSLLGFHQALLEHPCFAEGETCHGIVESEELAQRAEEFSHQATTVSGPSDGAGTRERVVNAELDGRRFELKLHLPEPPHAELARRRRERVAAGAHHGAARDAVVSPMQGTVLAVEVADGDDVLPGQVLCVVEAMKMENEITAHRAGRVTELSVEAGQAVKTGQVICVVQSE